MYFSKAILLLILVASLSACGGGSDDKTPPTNVAPVVDAGTEQGVDEQTSVTLSSTSSDSDGTISSYSWTQVSGETVTLIDADSGTLLFDAPTTVADLSLVFQLTVTDNDNATAMDQVTVNVAAVNTVPTVDAGTEQSVDEQTSVTLSSTSSDSDGIISSYSWTQVSGETVTLIDADSGTLLFDAPTTAVDLSLVFQLTVIDNENATAKDNVTVNVAAVNILPTVDAGSAKSVPVNTNMSLTAFAADQDGNISDIVWTQTNGDNLIISDVNQLILNIIIPTGYTGTSATFRVEVTDNEGAVATDEVIITIEPALTFVEYTADIDPAPLDNVELIIDPGNSSMTPATRGVDGYEAFMVAKDSDFNFTVTTTGLTLTGTNAPTFQVGDIIAGVTADETKGYMRKVIAINGTQLTTEMATLTETFPNAELDLAIRIANSGIATNLSTTVNGVSRSARSVDLLNFDRHIEEELTPGVKVVTDLQMNSGFDVDFSFSIMSRSITELSTVVAANYTTTAYLDVDLPYEYSRQFNKTFNPIFETTKVITIGVVPVVVNVKAVPAIGASVGMSAAGSLKYGFRNSATMETGFRYSNDTITNVANFTPTLTQIGPDYSLEGGVNLKANASVAVIVSLYEVNFEIPVVGKFEIDGPGIGVDLGPYAKFDVSASYNSTAIPPLTCLLDLTAGLASNLSIDYGIIGDQLNVANPENITLYDSNIALWHSDVCPFEGKVGGLAGSVFDGETSPIGGVTITVENTNSDVIANLTSDTNGLYEASDLAIGSYKVNFSKEGYESATVSIEVTENNIITVPQVLFLDEEEEGAVGMLSTIVVDAQDPTVIISGASIIVREGLNSPSGEYVTSFNSGGAAIEIELPIGYYTLEVSHEGYDTLYKSIAISSAETLNKSINLSSEGGGVGEGEARIVLTWGATPSDLDSHLTFDSEHIYYSHKNGGEVSLDVDDISSYGPETVTITSVSPDKTYSYYIYNYSRSGTFSASQAQVKFYFDGTTRTYNAPGGSGYYWNVFDVVNGTLVPCNSGCVSGSPSARSAKLGAAPFVMPPKVNN